jgi:hypothetical protein
MFPVNDFEMEGYEGNYRVASGHPAPAPRWHETLYVYQAYLSRIEEAIRRRLHGNGAASAGQPDTGWERNTGALHDISDIAARNNLPLAVAMLPHTRGFQTQRTIFGRVDEYCGQQRLRCFNLLEVFRATGVKDDASLRLNALDPHPNEKYNALIAQHLTPYLSAMLPARLQSPDLRAVALPQK